MHKIWKAITALGFILTTVSGLKAQPKAPSAQNPVIFADVPDVSMIRVGDAYYMASTTMHMSPGVPIMKSKDLVNWKMIGYAYDTLANEPELNLEGDKNAYGHGSWASSIRYHKGMFYVSTFSKNTGKTHIFSTRDIEKGKWSAVSFSPSHHDHSLFFEDDGKVYLIWGGGKIFIQELKPDLSGVIEGTKKVLIENASAPSGQRLNLPAEGSQLFKINGNYYLFNISWPKGEGRTVIIHKASTLFGPYEGRVGLADLGVAQGGLIDMPDGRWYAYLFRDYGAVGRIPYLVPVSWENGWPVLGINGKVPETLNLPASKGLIPGIVASDEFERRKTDPELPLVWQWNHNPDNRLWSVSERKGYLRLKTGRTETNFLQARNTLTQRTIGPVCTATTVLDISKMRDGDLAGLSLLQKNYGIVGVSLNGNQKEIVMINAASGTPEKIAAVALKQNLVYLKATCNFKNKEDNAQFFYSLDGNNWTKIGPLLKMTYTIPHFMGYRFGLFNFATKEPGGYVDLDYFRIEDRVEH